MKKKNDFIDENIIAEVVIHELTEGEKLLVNYLLLVALSPKRKQEDC